MRSQISLEATTHAERTIAERIAENLRQLEVSYEKLRAGSRKAPAKGAREARASQEEEVDEGDRIPRHEQDEDIWRFERPIPGRDPVTEQRGMGA
jgi:hypothetical protein